MQEQKLTKIVIDAYGNRYVACVHYGTIECRALGGARGCYDCSMLMAFLNRLHDFENRYDEFLEDDGYDDTS